MRKGKEGEKRRGKREKCGRHRGKKGRRELGRTRCFTVRLLDVNFEFIWHLLSEHSST